jgi:hypothetical protein
VVSAPVKPATTKSAVRVSAKSQPDSTNRPMLVAFTVAAIGIGIAVWLGLVPTGAPKPVSRTPVASRATPQPPVPTRTLTVERPAQSRPGPAEPPKLRAVKKEYALLTVASEPWGTLYIDNVEIGPTPVADYRLLPGTYRIRLEQEGYRTKRETIVISGPNPIRRRYSLDPQPQ